MRRIALLALLAVASCAEPMRTVEVGGIGSVAGLVTGPDVEGNTVPIPGVTVIIFHCPPNGACAGAIAASQVTDALGRYQADSLSAGPYGVGVTPPAAFAFNSGASFVSVPSGGKATADFLLQRQN